MYFKMIIYDMGFVFVFLFYFLKQAIFNDGVRAMNHLNSLK